MLPEEMPDIAGLPASVKYLTTQYLDDSHYQRLHARLSTNWDRLNSLSAAMKLMEQYGVVLSKEEMTRIQELDESQQINALVMKMPEQSNEQFQHFFLQLQLIVSTATRVRQALEEGQHEQVKVALDDADSTGIASYILKMAIVQAGTEVTMLKKHYEQWIKDADAKMSRLVRGQDDAIQAQKKLAAAEAKLAEYTTGQNEKAKKVLISLASGSDTAFRASVFKEWRLYIIREKEEKEIRAEYDVRIELAESRLVEFKAKQLNNVRSMLNKKAAEGDAILMSEVFKYIKDNVEEAKFDRENADKIREMEEKLNAYKSDNAEKTKALMTKMAAEGDQGLVQMVWNAFVSFHKDYLKNKDFEDAVKQSEKAIAAAMKNKKDGAKSILLKAGEGADSVLIGECFQGWATLYQEGKKERELMEALNAGQGKFSSFGDRNLKNSRGVADRARIMNELAIYLRIFTAWKLDAKTEATMHKYQSRIEAKKQQLLGVQTMFRNFATQLESSLKDSDNSAREAKYNQRISKKEGSVSLPNIHAR